VGSPIVGFVNVGIYPKLEILFDNLSPSYECVPMK